MSEDIGLNYIDSLKGWMSNKNKHTAEVITKNEFIRKINNNEFRYDIDDFEDNILNNSDKILIIKNKKNDLYSDIPPCGLYTLIHTHQHGVGITKFQYESDKYLNLYEKEIQKCGDDINNFFENKELYKELNIKHKMGILLYGPPGTGKTMFIESIIDNYLNKCRIIFVPSDFRLQGLEKLKIPLSDKHTIFIFEEITSNLNNNDYLFSFLNFLDGIYSWDNVLIIATTNYPEKIPGNIIDRPSRFDKIYKIDFPNRKIRKKYLKLIMGNHWLKEELLEEVLDKTKGLSIAYLKELCINCKINNYNPIDVINEFKIRKENIKKEFSSEISELGLKKRNIGFGDHDDEYYD